MQHVRTLNLQQRGTEKYTQASYNKTITKPT